MCERIVLCLPACRNKRPLNSTKPLFSNHRFFHYPCIIGLEPSANLKMTHQLTATPSAKATAQGSVYADAYGFGAQVWLKDHPTANTCPPTYVSIPDLVPGHAPPVYNVSSAAFCSQEGCL